MVRAPCFDKHGIKKGAWSQEEDNKLRVHIERSGHSNWRQLPKLAGLSRCGKSCRLRWMNYLRPTVKHGNFTKHEEDIVVALHNRLGNKWSMIAARLPGRSDNEIKNYWHTHLKNRAQKDQTHVLLQTEQHGNTETSKENPKAGFVVRTPNLKIQQEVEILLAVLSSSSPPPSSSSSSSTKSDQNESSPSSLSVSEANITTQCSEEAARSLLIEQFLQEEDDSIMLSSDKMFSPLGSVDYFISQDNVVDDVLLWPNLDFYY